MGIIILSKVVRNSVWLNIERELNEKKFEITSHLVLLWLNRHFFLFSTLGGIFRDLAIYRVDIPHRDSGENTIGIFPISESINGRHFFCRFFVSILFLYRFSPNFRMYIFNLSFSTHHSLQAFRISKNMKKERKRERYLHSFKFYKTIKTLNIAIYISEVYIKLFIITFNLSINANCSSSHSNFYFEHILLLFFPREQIQMNSIN